MKTPKVLLIYPPNQLNPTETARPDGSLGPLYLAAALERAGIEADILDASVGTDQDTLEDTFYKGIPQQNGLIRIGMPDERIREVIAKGGYNVVGVHSNFTPQTRMALLVAKIAKEVNPEMLVISGGVNARNMPERFLSNGLVDVICTTEGEKIIVRLIEKWAKGESIDDVSGTLFMHNGRVMGNPVQSGDTSMDLDELPIPAWHKSPLKKYAKILSPHGDVVLEEKMMYAPIMTSRGCPFKCAYCHISKEREFKEDIGNLRVKSVPRVIKEIETLKSLGVQKIYFEDDSLLAKKARVKEIFTYLLNAGLRIADVNGVNLVHFLVRNKLTGKLDTDEDYLRLLCDAGFDQIVFPIESGSQRILDKYSTGKLHLPTMDIIEMIRIASRVGITCPVNMMIGFPDETEEELMKSVEYAKRAVDAGAKYCSFFIPIPFPGCQLYDYAIQKGHLDPNFDPDTMNWHRPVLKNTVISPERVLELREWAWRTVNPPAYVAERLKKNIGNRWDSTNPATPAP
ncbi:MAG: radical SAM domain-containing protein [Parcubacteria group bacterium Gr01-1014_3]|nr:MAG: radical SAM domain-containing protein [Parcubacteria group bacterium Gr01-1014_3]